MKAKKSASAGDPLSFLAMPKHKIFKRKPTDGKGARGCNDHIV